MAGQRPSITMMLTHSRRGVVESGSVSLEQWSIAASIVTSVAATGTMGLLWWYCIETHRLRRATDELAREARPQTGRSFMPVVMFDFEPVGPSGDAVVRNVGTGPAFNITMASYRGEPCTLTLGSPPMLRPSDYAFVEATVDCEKRDQKAIVHSWQFRELFKTNQLPGRVQTTITYDSAYGKHFATLFSIVYNADTDYLHVQFESVKEPAG